MSKNTELITINSISELHRLMALPKPMHPLVSLVRLQDVPPFEGERDVSVVLNLYTISLKKYLTGKLKYGQGYYDFDEGVLGMTAPGQVLTSSAGHRAEGWWFVFHPDLIQGYPLATAIKKYGFFSYVVNEALHLSEKEEQQLEVIFQNIAGEYQSSIDVHSQDLMVTQLELLLTYANRYYNRQFITRKPVAQPIVTQFEKMLDEYFNDELYDNKLPNVAYFSDRLNISAHYLSDLLRKYTGQNTQQHIHSKLIEIAKTKLSTTNLSVSEIAYELGFEHPQSFSKLFKSKEKMTAVEYRQMFN